MKLIVAGIDPAITNFGFARGEYDLETGLLDVHAIQLTTTESRSGKQVRKNSDDLRRATEQTEALHEWIRGCGFVFAEIPTGSQSARGSFSNGACLGILSSVGRLDGFDGRLIQVLPNEVKMAAVGSKHASKEEMIEWASDTYPDLPWPRYRGNVQKKAEHMADAIGAIQAGVQTDEFINIAATLKKFFKAS